MFLQTTNVLLLHVAHVSDQSVLSDVVCELTLCSGDKGMVDGVAPWRGTCQAADHC